MRLAIMQPYFLPYIGYFQLISAVDLFVVYDNIQYTKKGWFNRNRYLLGGKAAVFSIPLMNDSDFLDVRDRSLSPDFKRTRLLNQFKEAYRGAPYFDKVDLLIQDIIQDSDLNLFGFIHNSIVRVCKYLGIETKIVVSSSIKIDHALRGQEKVLALCGAAGAKEYINSIGGTDLYSRDEFRKRGVELRFIKPKPFLYRQFDKAFVPWLSILDVIMFNPVAVIQECLASNYEMT